ncbi:MAG: acyl carrier protein [Acidimicrobiia bacterium]|nr:acyl carrier protein [Acidimicrobiia bacterium]
MTSERHDAAVVQAVRDALEEVVGIEFGDDDLDRPLEDTGVDSLDLIEVVMVAEEALDISVPQDAFEGVTTLRAAISVFEIHNAGV